MNGTLRAGVILEKITGPLSRGHLELRNLDPDDTPFVTFNYFKEPEDLRRCIQGMRTIISVINSKAFSKFRYKKMPIEALINLMLTLPINNRRRHANAMFSLEQFCIDTVMTIWHYHGGCQVGRVVDKEYKVLGVDSLRVVDGSTFHQTPGTNPQATVMMLGRQVYTKHVIMKLYCMYSNQLLINFLSRNVGMWEKGLFMKDTYLEDQKRRIDRVHNVDDA